MGEAKSINSKTIYIHIGPTKTGSTTLQKFFQKLSEANRELILYPETGRFLDGEPYYRDDKYRGKVLEKGPMAHHLILHLKLINKVSGEHTDCLWENLKREIANFPGSKIILSSEMFWILSEQEISNLCHILEEYDLKVVLYIRNQSRRLFSLYTQSIKQGTATSNFLHFIDSRKHRICEEINIMERWTKKMPAGKEALIIRNFDDVVKQSSLEDDFLNNVLHEKLEYKLNQDYTIHENAKLKDRVYQAILCVNDLEHFLRKPKLLRPFFYKIRDLILKSKKIRKIVDIFELFLEKPLVNEQEMAQLREIVAQKIESLEDRDKKYYKSSNE